MKLCRFQRKYEQLSQSEREIITNLMKARWLVRREARQLCQSDCIVRRCWDKWIQEISLLRRPLSGCPRQTSR
ncbi:HTH_Tnp_Tc3_2 domain-containing protein [Trichonephila clavipes]|nr:HTH_Tnp_Tc3_2 domain-containing protein [Trichonephila clavipes]